MLTKENSSGFIRQDFPTYEYHSKSSRSIKACCDGSHITPCPKGYREVVRYANADEAFADYLKSIIVEHKNIPDTRFKEKPYGIFIGHWRNARWFDEAKRRNLAEPTKVS